MTYNLGYTTDKPKYFIPISMMLQEMLETCRNTDEAIKVLYGNPCQNKYSEFTF